MPGGFDPVAVAVEGGDPISLSVAVTNSRKGRIRFVSEPANGWPGVTIPEATPKKDAAQVPSPEGQAKRRDRLLDDEEVHEVLQEERTADYRATMDVRKALEAVAWMEQCIRDGHKIYLGRH
jgi:hypothetical protein